MRSCLISDKSTVKCFGIESIRIARNEERERERERNKRKEREMERRTSDS